MTYFSKSCLILNVFHIMTTESNASKLALFFWVHFSRNKENLSY